MRDSTHQKITSWCLREATVFTSAVTTKVIRGKCDQVSEQQSHKSSNGRGDDRRMSCYSLIRGEMPNTAVTSRVGVTEAKESMKTDNGQRCVTRSDRRRLGRWLDEETACSWSDSVCRDKLGFALERAEAVDAQRIPGGLVTMNSTVRLSEKACGKQWTATLVYPDDVDLVANAISVLDPCGTALLGRRVGDLIQWSANGSRRDVRIDDVVYQHERAGSVAPIKLA